MTNKKKISAKDVEKLEATSVASTILPADAAIAGGGDAVDCWVTCADYPCIDTITAHTHMPVCDDLPCVVNTIP